MSASTSADLAVAFRSLARRLIGAQNDQTPVGAVAGAQRDIDAAVSGAAHVLGSAATPEAVATALEARRAVDWSEDQLSAIQTYADSAGRAIRQIERLSERA